MKVLVTELPRRPHQCVFANYDSILASFTRYEVAECRLSDYGSYECTDVTKCPYLKVLEVNADE